jgi:hypothetical protein
MEERPVSTWIKIFNALPANPKYLMAGDRACWLAICGLCYSNEHLTDGFIAAPVLPVAAPGVKGPEKLAAKLVEVGLWHPVDGGWQIHDYGDYQRSAAEVRESRAADAARKADKRSGRSPAGQISDSGQFPLGVQGDREEESREEKLGPSVLVEHGSTDPVRPLFVYWQERTGHARAMLTKERRQKLKARLSDGYTPEQIREAIDGAVVNPPVDRDSGVVYDDLMSICRNGAQMERYMQRAAVKATPGLQAVPASDTPSSALAERQQRGLAAIQRMANEDRRAS